MGLGTFFKILFKSENQIKTYETFKRYETAKDKLKQISENNRLKIMNNVSDELEIIHNKNNNFIDQTIEKDSKEYTQIMKDSLEASKEFVKNIKPHELNNLMKVYDDIYELNKPRKDGLSFEGRVFFRKDLKRDSKDRTFEDIDYHDLYTSSITTIQLATMLVFVDDNGDTKIIKNRYGKHGIIK